MLFLEKVLVKHIAFSNGFCTCFSKMFVLPIGHKPNRWVQLLVLILRLIMVIMIIMIIMVIIMIIIIFIIIDHSDDDDDINVNNNNNTNANTNTNTTDNNAGPGPDAGLPLKGCRAGVGPMQGSPTRIYDSS